MDQPYSFGADLLNKFHTSSDWIQALWLIASAMTVLGIAYLATQVLREALRLRQHERLQPDPPDGYLLCSIYRNAHGELMLYRHGESESIGKGELPSPL